MLTVIVGSTNPVKIQATREGFAAMFPASAFDVQGIEVESGVNHQPFGEAETLQGALQRARNAHARMPDADYAVGIEGGVLEIAGDLMAFAWVVVLAKSDEKRIGKATSGAFLLPNEISALIRQGLELGEADDRVFGQQDSKRRNGSIGLLTGDALTRAGFYAPAVLMALIPFRNMQLSFGSEG